MIEEIFRAISISSSHPLWTCLVPGVVGRVTSDPPTVVVGVEASGYCDCAGVA